jgi:hypothetical protein
MDTRAEPVIYVRASQYCSRLEPSTCPPASWPSPWHNNETRRHNHATWPLRSHMNGSARSGIIAFVRDDWSVAKEKLSAQRSRVRRCRVSRIGPALPLGQSTLREVLMCCMFSPHARSTSTSLGICTHFSGRVATRAASCSRKKLSDAPTKFRPMRQPLRLRPRTLSSRNNRGMPRRNANAQTFYGVHPYQLAVDSTRKRCHYYVQYHRRTMFNTLSAENQGPTMTHYVLPAYYHMPHRYASVKSVRTTRIRIDMRIRSMHHCTVR